MSTIVYTVISSGGEYVDMWEHNVCAYFNKSMAEQHVSELNEELENVREIHRRFEDNDFKPIMIRDKLVSFDDYYEYNADADEQDNYSVGEIEVF